MLCSRAVLSLALALALLSGCKGDPNTPEYWEKKLSGAKKPDARVQVVEALRTSKRPSSVTATATWPLRRCSPLPVKPAPWK